MPAFKPVKGMAILNALILSVAGKGISTPLPEPGSTSMKYSAFTRLGVAGEAGYGTTTAFEKITLLVKLHTPAKSFVRMYRRCKPGVSAAPFIVIEVVRSLIC